MRRRIDEALLGLAAVPPVGDIRKLQGVEGYRLRVGEWRVIFRLLEESEEILVIAIRPRSSAYRYR
jgi:mRNA interferase RelE/StbE